jgi:hypothetical protein
LAQADHTRPKARGILAKECEKSHQIPLVEALLLSKGLRGKKHYPPVMLAQLIVEEKRF